MIETLEFLAAPLALSFLLVGIHAYLGLHVLERDVIFVDISLSQVAALGTALSLFFFSEDNQQGALFFSLALCLLASLMLAIFRHFEHHLSQEVLIGITYAFANGALILVADRLPHGAEHLKEALVGNILYVTWPTVGITAAVYAVVGLIHYMGRKAFWEASRGVSKSFRWDFLFYLLFGVVITLSTHHAGVLVVFAILIVPAALAKRFFGALRSQLLFAWVAGFIGILTAFLLSYKLDWPAGAGIVTVLTTLFFLILGGTIIYEAGFGTKA